MILFGEFEEALFDLFIGGGGGEVEGLVVVEVDGVEGEVI